MRAAGVDVGHDDVVFGLAADHQAIRDERVRAAVGGVNEACLGALVRCRRQGLVLAAGEHHGVGDALGLGRLRLAGRHARARSRAGDRGTRRGCAARGGSEERRLAALVVGEGAAARLVGGRIVVGEIEALLDGGSRLAVGVVFVVGAVTRLIAGVAVVVVVVAVVGLGLGTDAAAGGVAEVLAATLLGVSAARAVARGLGRQAVALHLLFAQLGDDGGGDRLGDDVELAVLERVVHDEAHQRLAIHHQAVLGGLGGKVGFGLAGERGVVAEQALVVVGVHQHGVERGGVLLAGAHHLLAAHLLLGFLGDLHRGQGRARHLVGGALDRVFHLAFEP